MKYDMREVLVRKGTELFYREGFASTSIRDIGRAAGISSATLYHYFKTKDDLLYEIIKTIGDHLIIILNQTKQEFDDPKERLKQMIFRQICLLKDKREEVKIYIEEQYQLPRRLKAIIYKQHRKVYETYLEEIQKLSERGVLRPNLHLPTINFSLFAMMNWVYRWFKNDGPISIEEEAKMIIEILFNGILIEHGKGMIQEKKGRGTLKNN
ncbi:MAG: TetR/AcrR family transcriptional regulator [Thermodesulfobacteriota bacterium]|nr:TetR/AcrR family transcriptional regulator [Thermodesulfobacteriota bacterium]